SGIVTGIVHRRVVETGGLRASQRKLVRRAGLIYVVQVALTIAILAVRSWREVGSFGNVPTWAESGGVGRGILSVLRLRLELDFNDILPMYVCFLAWAVLAVALLRRRRAWLVALISVAVYVVAQTIGGLALKPDSWNIGSWQLLFTAGLLVGWSWEHERLNVTYQSRRRLSLVALGVWAGLFVCALVARASMEHEFGRALDRLNGGWLAFVFAGAAMLVAFPLLDRLWRVRRLNRPLRVVGVVGSKGLPGFVTMVLAILVLDLVPSIPRSDPVNLAVMVLCGCAEYVALRRHRHARWHPVSRALGNHERLSGSKRSRVATSAGSGSD
ncbi:MAG TPA: OpgC domain-containing protein, partial [Ilumatobacteraceae bacterium]|nr:OpgC domain-containing protein [Ilumatobacteraceae bacterium]